jgi:hypothetical protein
MFSFTEIQMISIRINSVVRLQGWRKYGDRFWRGVSLGWRGDRGFRESGRIGLVVGFGGASLPKNEIKKQRPRSILPIQKSSIAGEKTRIIPINLEQAEGQRFVDGEGSAST